MRKLTPEIHKAVNETLNKDVRDEAFEILFLTSNKHRKEFLKMYEQDKGNICCLILDYAKKELVIRKILEQKENDGFGHFPFEK